MYLEEFIISSNFLNAITKSFERETLQIDLRPIYSFYALHLKDLEITQNLFNLIKNSQEHFKKPIKKVETTDITNRILKVKINTQVVLPSSSFETPVKPKKSTRSSAPKISKKRMTQKQFLSSLSVCSEKLSFKDTNDIKPSLKLRKLQTSVFISPIFKLKLFSREPVILIIRILHK